MPRLPLPLRLLALLPLAAALALAGCDSGAIDGDFDPDAVDFDALTSLSYTRYVGPLLAARDAFAPTATTGRGDAADYAWDAVFEGEAGAAIVPFDAEGSLLVKLLEDLPADAALPYPNLRRLQDDELRYLKRWIEAGAPNDAGDVPYADAGHVLYVCVQQDNRVALVDATTYRVIRNVYLDDHGFPIPGGAAIAQGPHAIAFEPDGSAWYATLIAQGRVLKLDTDLAMDPSDPAYLLGATPAGYAVPGLMMVDPHSDKMYVGRSTFSPAGTPGLAVVDRQTMAFEPLALPEPFDIPHAIALTPDGRFLLAASLTQGRVAVIETATESVVDVMDLAGPRELVHFGLLPGGATASLTSGNTNSVLLFALSPEGQLTLDGEVPVGERPWHAHVDHDGRTLLVPNRAGHSITLLDIPTRATRTYGNTPQAAPFAQPHSPAPSHDGSVVFVTNSNANGMYAPRYPFLAPAEGGAPREPLPNEAQGNLTVLDAATGAVVAVVDLGRFPSGVEHLHTGGGGHH